MKLVKIYLICFNKITIPVNFLAFFLGFFPPGSWGVWGLSAKTTGTVSVMFSIFPKQMQFNKTQI